jgi:hypothetical protein
MGSFKALLFRALKLPIAPAIRAAAQFHSAEIRVIYGGFDA